MSFRDRAIDFINDRVQDMYAEGCGNSDDGDEIRHDARWINALLATAVGMNDDIVYGPEDFANLDAAKYVVDSVLIGIMSSVASWRDHPDYKKVLLG